MRTALSFAALFLSVIFLQLHAGALGPLDALGGLQEGFSTTEIGVLGSAHFVGFFIGCWGAPRLMGSTGHIRAFAAFAATGAIAALLHPLFIDPVGWAVMRVATGLCVAGCYTIVEAWLQAKVTNETRGRTLGIYRFVDLGASVAAQLLIGFLTPAAYASYNILAILACAALLPLVLTTSKPPPAPIAPRLRPLKAFRLSPLGVAGVITAGVTMPSFRMVGPIYGREIGLTVDQIGFFPGSRPSWRGADPGSRGMVGRQDRPALGFDPFFRSCRSSFAAQSARRSTQAQRSFSLPPLRLAQRPCLSFQYPPPTQTTLPNQKMLSSFPPV